MQENEANKTIAAQEPKQKRGTKTKQVTICMKPDLYEAGRRQAEQLGLSFSSYINMLIAQSEKK